MRVLLAQLAPTAGAVGSNLRRLEGIVRSASVDLAVFPELYLSGYRVGDAFHRLGAEVRATVVPRLARLATASRTAVAVGAPYAASRVGEVHNAVLLASPRRPVFVQVKRYLPSYGPFEEGSVFSPTDQSRVTDPPGPSLGLQICYDAFFPEVSRELALGGADLLVVVSAAPVTSGRLFAKVLPARAVENAIPLVYVNRVGVEDGVVFGGGSGAWDARGEPLMGEPIRDSGLGRAERLDVVTVDPTEHARWRPFRPVLRDVSARRPKGSTDPPPPSAAVSRTDP